MKSLWASANKFMSVFQKVKNNKTKITSLFPLREKVTKMDVVDLIIFTFILFFQYLFLKTSRFFLNFLSL